MKLTVPSLEISDDLGFSNDLDIFNRKSFGQELSNLVKNCDDEVVIAIDAPWGEGKTTFVKMWQGLLSEEEIFSIYFDAFENDYQKDPFMAIVSEIYSLIKIDHEDEASEFRRKSVAALKTLGRASLRVGVKVASAGVLDETIFDDTSTIKDASKEASDLLDSIVSKKLEKHKEDKKSITEFKKYLGDLPEKLSKGKPIVFIIDELDRCKPSFALEIVENIKHLFSVPKVVFVLVMNRSQLEESVRREYGSNVEAHKYLYKFINIWANLPKNRDQYNCDIKKYVSNCLRKMDFEVKTRIDEAVEEVFQDYAEYYDLSMRDIERSLTNFALVYNITDGRPNLDCQWLFPYISIIKTIHPGSYRKLRAGKTKYKQLVSETGLGDLHADWWEEKPESHPLKWFLRYHLCNEEERKALLEEGANESKSGYGNKSTIEIICRYLDTFQRS